MILRRQLMQLAALGGGAVALSRLAGCSAGSPFRGASGAGEFSFRGASGAGEFYFVQLSDSHWGFSGPPNPGAANTLRNAVAAVNGLEVPPAFVVFTGDLTHTTDDPDERRKRMAQFREIVGALRVKQVHFMPGEHDASLDHGAAFREFFGDTSYAFDHQGVHFVALDNVSDPGARLGDAQLAWLRDDLRQRPKDSPIVVLTHRPLFDLAPKWDWATRDGAQALDILGQYPHVTVFYGHIHQEHHQMTGHIAHHSARSLMFALPAPGSQPQRTPIAWDPSQPNRGLGFREVAAKPREPAYALQEFEVTGARHGQA